MASSKRVQTRRFNKLRSQFYDRCRRKRLPCWLCGQPIDYDVDPGTTPDSLTLDHRIPVSKRPDLQEDPGNFEPAHLSCNTRRGDADPHQSIGMLSRKWVADE